MSQLPVPRAGGGGLWPDVSLRRRRRRRLSQGGLHRPAGGGRRPDRELDRAGVAIARRAGGGAGSAGPEAAAARRRRRRGGGLRLRRRLRGSPPRGVYAEAVHALLLAAIRHFAARPRRTAVQPSRDQPRAGALLPPRPRRAGGVRRAGAHVELSLFGGGPSGAEDYERNLARFSRSHPEGGVTEPVPGPGIRGARDRGRVLAPGARLDRGRHVALFLAPCCCVYGKDLDRRPTPEATPSATAPSGTRPGPVPERHGARRAAAPGAGGGVGPGPAADPRRAGRPRSARLKDLREEARDRGRAPGAGAPQVVARPAAEEPAGMAGPGVLLSSSEVERMVRGSGTRGWARSRSSAPAGPWLTASWDRRRSVCGSTSIPSSDAVPELDPVVSLLRRPDRPARGSGEAGDLPISDPDLLNNQGLDQDGNAERSTSSWSGTSRATARRLRRDDDMASTGSRACSPRRCASRWCSPCSSRVLLAGWSSGRAWGASASRCRRRRGSAAGKEVLIDNTAKLLTDGGHAADSLRLLPADDAGGRRPLLPAPGPAGGGRLARLQRSATATAGG